MPKELDIPHWAREAIANFRQRMGASPDWLNDRMIYQAMMVIDNDDARRADLIRDLAITTYLYQQKAIEDAAGGNHASGK